MPFIVGCKKGKHPDYQVWGAQSNCMKKMCKMKKGSSFKEWYAEDENLILEGLFDSLADQLKKYSVRPSLFTKGHVTRTEKETPEEDSKKLNILLGKIPWDMKPAVDKLLRTGNIEEFKKDLQNKPTGSSF
jgi:hypothetical protein